MDRVARERAFYNAKADTYRMLRRLIWRAIGEFNRNHEVHRLEDPVGKAVLLYGCGPGYGAREMLAKGAATVTGIDISDAEIAEAKRKATAGGYADKVDLRVADAHNTGFPDDSFDLIVGSAIIHHLDLGLALEELRRILRPSGRAVFREPLLDNPFLRLGRRLTPGARTPDEHPLTVADWELCASVFPGFRHYEVECLVIPLMPLNLFLPRRWQKRWAAGLSAWDDRMLERFPALRRFARTTFLVLE